MKDDTQGFYDDIAKQCDLEQLDKAEIERAYRVRDQVRRSFEKKGPTVSPYVELVSKVTWIHVQNELYNNSIADQYSVKMGGVTRQQLLDKFN